MFNIGFGHVRKKIQVNIRYKFNLCSLLGRILMVYSCKEKDGKLSEGIFWLRGLDSESAELFLLLLSKEKLKCFIGLILYLLTRLSLILFCYNVT
jgi:hypothetical protein